MVEIAGSEVQGQPKQHKSLSQNKNKTQTQIPPPSWRFWKAGLHWGFFFFFFGLPPSWFWNPDTRNSVTISSYTKAWSLPTLQKDVWLSRVWLLRFSLSLAVSLHGGSCCKSQCHLVLPPTSYIKFFFKKLLLIKKECFLGLTESQNKILIN